MRNSRKNSKRITLLLMALMVWMSTSAAFGQGLIFTDIRGHWAEEYIQDIYERKIISGYDDATFRPNNTVTGLEMVVMVSKLLGYDPAKDKDVTTYVDLLEKNNIPSWAQEYVSYLITNGIVMEEELHVFVTNGSNNAAKRSEVVNYFGRVLVYHGNSKLSRVFVLPYKDEYSIPQMTRPYVDLLLREGLLNPSSNNGNFLPNNTIARGEVSKLFSMAAEILDRVWEEKKLEEEIKKEEEKKKQEEQKKEEAPVVEEKPKEDIVEEKIGLLNNILRANRTVLTLESQNGETLLYDVSKDVKVIVDGKAGDLSNLQKGQSLQVRIINNVITEMRATTHQASFKGHFVRFLTGTNTVLTLRDNNGTTKVFVIPPNTKITLDERDATLSNFKEGDVVSIYENARGIVAVEGKSKTKTFRGVITNRSLTTPQTVEVTTKDQEVILLPIENNTKIVRDGKVVPFSQIRTSDEVHIELEYDKLKTLTASTVKRSVKGQIVKILMGEESYVTVETSERVKEDLPLLSTTLVIVDNELGEMYDLRVGRPIEVFIESNEVVRIMSSKKAEPKRILGTVVHTHSTAGVITTKVEEEGKEVQMQVNTNNNTIYIGMNGGRIHFNNIKAGDEILMIGEMNKGVFVAERIVIISTK